MTKPQRVSIWIMQQKLTKAREIVKGVEDQIFNDPKRKEDEDWREVDGALEEAQNWLHTALGKMDKIREYNQKLKEALK